MTQERERLAGIIGKARRALYEARREVGEMDAPSHIYDLATADAILSDRAPRESEDALLDAMADAYLDAISPFTAQEGRTVHNAGLRAALTVVRRFDPALAALRAELEEAREALKPFAEAHDLHLMEHECAAEVGGWVPMDDDYPLDGTHLGHFARARAFLDRGR